MSLQTCFFYVTVSLLSSSFCTHPDSTEKPGCFKVNSCKCIMKDGTGIINLKAMGDAEGFLGHLRPVKVENMSANVEILFSFSPCQHFSQPEDPTGSDCTNVAACLVIRHQDVSGYFSRHINYGRHEGNEFHYNHSLKMLSVSYFAYSKQPMTVVHYHCNPNQSISFVREHSLSTTEHLQIWVESPCACPNACAMGDLGLGTIFLIILALSAAAYFILGSCALKPVRSDSGVQIFPERSLWCNVCYLCGDRRPGGRHYADLTHTQT